MSGEWVTPDQLSRMCFFCGDRFVPRPGTTVEDEDFVDEYGEFWSEKMQESVLGHPDCIPNGIESIFDGTNTEWKMA